MVSKNGCGGRIQFVELGIRIFSKIQGRALMSNNFFRIPQVHYDILISHLLPPNPKNEEAGFALADMELNFKEWLPMKPQNFVSRSKGYLELKDGVRGNVIKRAHDTNSILIEFHSHPFPWPAQFSDFDLEGLSEIVPHIRWRLKRKAYLAVVVAPSGFDALVWNSETDDASGLDGIVTENKTLVPTGLTLKSMGILNGH